MKVIRVAPGKKAEIVEISGDLESLQSEVGGYIEAVYPFEEEVALVCNEDGKFNGSELNRALNDEETGETYDVVFGTFLVVGLTEDNFGDIPEQYIDKFFKMFEEPKPIVRIKGTLYETL